MATLPSFAQAFSSHSLAKIPPSTNALPPIKRSRPDDLNIKEEHSDGPAPAQRLVIDTAAIDIASAAPAPSATIRPSPNKRRRVTISGAPHPLNTNVRTSPDNPTPISPVVMGLTINSTAVEKVKSMISVKQKQKALIEQRRGSVVPVVMSPSRPNSAVRRVVAPSSPPKDSLPPPPISFARRRAEQLGSLRKKPADILISPRDPHAHQPAIQSAPPVPHAAGRFPMSLPRLPSVLAAPDSPNIRRVATAVPPTPTRLSIHHRISSTTNSSPPAASVPIASSLVPPTPAGFHQPGYTGDKAAFLAPFELFYDALNDSKQLKSWLAEQLQRSNSMIHALSQQQENLNEIVDSLVEKQVAPIRHEMLALQRRIEELEDALRNTNPTRLGLVDNKHKPSSSNTGSKTPLRNGITNSPMPTESYTFPPPPPPPSSSSSSSSSTANLEPSLSSRRRTDIQRHSTSSSSSSPMILADADSDSPVPAPFDPPRRMDTTRSLPPVVPQQRLSPRDLGASPNPKGKTLAERPRQVDCGPAMQKRNSVMSDAVGGGG